MDNNNISFRGEVVLIVSATTFIIATIFVAGRLVSRFGILKKGTLDDWAIILAWVRTLLNNFFFQNHEK